MKSAGNGGGALKGSLQVLHIHVLLVAPLGAGHMAQPGADQHEARVSVREPAHLPGTPADLPLQPLHDIVGPDASPVFTGEIAVGKRLLNAIFQLLGGLLQLHGTQFLHHGFGFLPGSFLGFLGADRFEHFPRKGDAMALSGKAAKSLPIATSFTLERGVTKKTLR